MVFNGNKTIAGVSPKLLQGITANAAGMSYIQAMVAGSD